MGEFFNTLGTFRKNFKIGTTDFLWLALHYPLFKLSWLAEYGNPRGKLLATKLTPLFQDYVISIQLPLKCGKKIRLPISFSSSDLSSFKEIFWGQEYASPFNLENCKSYVDLGSNTGMAGIYFLTQMDLKKAIFVEANPNLAKEFEARIQRYQLPGDFKIANVAASGDKYGDTLFHISDNHRMSHLQGFQTANSPGKEVTISCVPLRELLKRHQFETVDLLKMDIEGGEFEIMNQDPEIFRQFRFLFVEVHGDRTQRDSFCTKVTDLGFHIESRKHSTDCCEIMFAERVQQTKPAQVSSANRSI